MLTLISRFNSKLVRLEVSMCVHQTGLHDCFNSKLVRLEGKYIRCSITRSKRFNSKLVRLEDFDRCGFSVICVSFNSKLVRLEAHFHQRTSDDTPKTRFNSKLVRLEDAALLKKRASHSFQFQTGAIRSLKAVLNVLRYSCFNSKLVRLEVTYNESTKL